MTRLNVLFAALVLFLLLRVPVSPQGRLREDNLIIENQKQIISIVLSLNESANIREDIFKLDMKNFQDEKKAFQKEKVDFQKQKEYYEQIDKDIPILKDSLERQSKQLKKETNENKILKSSLVMTITLIIIQGLFSYIK